MSNYRDLWRVVALILAAGITHASAADEPAWSWGPAQKQLRMGVAIEYAPDAMPSDVLIRLENVGKKDLNVNLGITLGNGEAYYPQALFLLATDSAGVTHRFNYSMPAGVFGRVDPFVVPMPAGSAYLLRCQVSAFFMAGDWKEIDSLSIGRFKLAAGLDGRAVTMGGIDFMQYWTGTLRSGELTMDIP